MFTGIITDLGKVKHAGDDGMFEIETKFDLSTIPQGASIACNGVCLTLIEKTASSFTAHVSPETLSCTTLSSWQAGTPINLEQPLKVGEELGGHIVSGHVDGVGEVTSKTPEGENMRFQFKAPKDLYRFIAPKGSVTINGVSLTVNEVEGDIFGVNIIPHTQNVTTFGTLNVGDKVNIEIDMLARYMARYLETK
jgi:riboflavin synthase